MRDARLIREHDPFGPRTLLLRSVRGIVFVAALAASFSAGRWVERGTRSRAPAARPQGVAPQVPDDTGGTDDSAGAKRGERGAGDLASARPGGPASAEALQPLVFGGALCQGETARHEGLTPVQRQAALAGEYTLHLATLASRAEARALASQMQRRGYPPFLYAASGSGSKTLVRLGRFASPAEAEAVRARLARGDIQATVVRQGATDVLLDRGHGHGRGH